MNWTSRNKLQCNFNQIRTFLDRERSYWRVRVVGMWWICATKLWSLPRHRHYGLFRPSGYFDVHHEDIQVVAEVVLEAFYHPNNRVPSRGPCHYHGLTLTPSRINNYIRHRLFWITSSAQWKGIQSIKLIEAERGIYASVNTPSFVQIMACRLVGTKPLSEPMLEYGEFET